MRWAELVSRGSSGCGCVGADDVPAADEPEWVPVYTPGGRIRFGFPAVDVEMEFRQRERALGGPETPPGERAYQVLSRNPHLARGVDYLWLLGNRAQWQLQPASEAERTAFLEAIRRGDDPEVRSVVVGRSPTRARPGAVALPLVEVELVFTYTLAELVAGLRDQVESALADPVARRHLFENEVTRDFVRQANPTLNLGRFEQDARRLYRRLAGATEQAGSLDEDRALNYALLQHPGPYVAYSLAIDASLVLERLETIANELGDGARSILLGLTFANRASGVASRLATRVDVTGTWPFVDNSSYEGPTLFGLFPWVPRA